MIYAFLNFFSIAIYSNINKKVPGKFVGIHIIMTIHPNEYNSISITGSNSKYKVHISLILHTNYWRICFAGSRECFFKINLNSLRPPNSPSRRRINFVLSNLNLRFARTIPAKFRLIWFTDRWRTSSVGNSSHDPLLIQYIYIWDK